MDAHTCVTSGNEAKIQAMTTTELRSLGLGETEERAYKALLKEQATSVEELACLLAVPRARLDAALDRLAEHGFTVPDRARPPGVLPIPAPPAAAIRTLIHRRQADLHRRSAELERLRMSAGRIAGRLMSSSPTVPEGSIEVITGARAIVERAELMLAAAEYEVLILDRPPYAKGDEGDPDSTGLDIGALLDRGVEVRGVIDREGLTYPGRMHSLTELAERGLRVRFTSGVPTKLIAVDRRTTLLPATESADPTASGIALNDMLLHNVLLPLFETLWHRATPLGAAGGPLSQPQKELLGLLAAGLKDEAIGRRLGVHVHTARKRISQLMETLDAETRFQAGAQAALRGWLNV
jgi:sugar-specific transcriptional regulator TrmB/DNA-binding CsgD family transcriptional regulator